MTPHQPQGIRRERVGVGDFGEAAHSNSDRVPTWAIVRSTFSPHGRRIVSITGALPGEIDGSRGDDTLPAVTGSHHPTADGLVVVWGSGGQGANEVSVLGLPQPSRRPRWSVGENP